MDSLQKYGPLKVYRQVGPAEEELAMSANSATEFFRNDIVRHRISGVLPSDPDYKTVNFEDSVLFQAAAEGVDFSECDFKDTLLKGCHFHSCRFDICSFATVFIEDCLFEACTFYNFSGHNLDIYGVVFRRCDLTNLLITSSRLVSATFECCKTTNRICELSTFTDCRFRGTNIQVETIYSNFGLKSEALIDGSLIRSGRPRESFHFIPLDGLQEVAQERELSSLETLRLEFFLRHHLLNGSEALDSALDLKSWAGLYKNPGGFLEHLDKLTEFLASVYEANEVTAHSVLLLHYVTSTLTERLPLQNPRIHKISMTLAGAHLILSRFVEEFLETLSLWQGFVQGNRLAFEADGPLDKEYYSELLTHWLSGEPVSVDRVLPRNSPVELVIVADVVKSLVPIVAMFLATRTRVELAVLRARWGQAGEGPSGHGELPSIGTASEAEVEEVERDGVVGKNAGDPPSLIPLRDREEVFHLKLGPEKVKDEDRYGLRVRSLLPGSLVVDLRLDFSTVLAGRLRTTLKNLL